ncbi:MAG: tdk [Candidatus Doudnabacteria bacterium]|nr:tdk [Candidatus Doudnabacteria bacterium]
MAYMKVITGPMFSGKTEELIRVLNRAEIAGKKILVIKPKIDIRTENEIASRRKADIKANEFKKYSSFYAYPVGSAAEVLSLINVHQPSVLGIDEAQFFDAWMIDFLAEFLKNNSENDLTIVAAGLDMDAWGRPFGIMPQLMTIADHVQKETAICFVCKKPAIFTQKLSESSSQVEVGDFDIYEARCRVCHFAPIQKQKRMFE